MCWDIACGVGDSCQVILLRKAEDTRPVTLTGEQIRALNPTSCHNVMVGWGCWRAAVLPVESGSRWKSWPQGCSRNSWRVRGWCGDRSHRRAGEGGSSGSLRSSGKNWSEQAGDCSRCLIRTDVTQHNPPQQFVLRLEQVIFEKKVQTACEAAALCPMTAQPVNHGAHLSCAHTSPHTWVLYYWATIPN